MTSTAPQNAPSLPALKSVSVIQFGPGTGADPVLFVGDSRSAALFAFELEPVQAPAAPQFYNFHDLDVAIAGLLGAPLDEIAVKGLAVHPVSQDAYIAVQRGHGDRMLPVIVRANARRELAALDLTAIPGTHVALPNPIGEGTETRNHLKTRNFTITSLAFHGGEVLVSGLSNADFASTLYRIPYPFQGAVAASSIEMYHAMHAQKETRAPIQTMAIMQLGGAPHVLAAYTCTPLVTIPLEALKDGAHVQAKTIGELGYGNTPITVLPFKARDRQGQEQTQVLITHKNRGPMLFTGQAIEERNAQEGMSTGVGTNVVAPPFTMVPMSGLLQVADENAQCLLGLRRDLDSGRLALLSFEKGSYFRVTEFMSEFQMPGYVYQNPGLKAWQESKYVQEDID